MTKFEKARNYVVENATRLEACSSQLNRAKKSTNNLELLKVISDNIGWVFDNKLFTGESIEKYFSKSDLVTSGVGNLGDSNTGFSNAGSYNAGNRNAGYSNAGSDNAGSYNAGSYNAGNRNAGYSNAGSDNAGAFNNLQANYVMFNKPSTWTYNDFINSQAYRLLSSIDTTIYIPSNMMSESEKTDHPYHITTGGYMKHLPYKEVFVNAWNNWDEDSKAAFTSLPNFDPEIFFDITGVKI